MRSVDPLFDLSSGISPDLKPALLRLEPVQGDLGSRIVQTIKNELNRIYNIVVTRKFSTEAQVSVLLNREIKRVFRHIESSRLGGRTGTPVGLIECEWKLSKRKEFMVLIGRVEQIRDKIAQNVTGRLDEFEEFKKTLNDFQMNNQSAIVKDERTVEEMKDAIAQEEKQKEAERKKAELELESIWSAQARIFQEVVIFEDVMNMMFLGNRDLLCRVLGPDTSLWDIKAFDMGKLMPAEAVKEAKKAFQTLEKALAIGEADPKKWGRIKVDRMRMRVLFLKELVEKMEKKIAA